MESDYCLRITPYRNTRPTIHSVTNAEVVGGYTVYEQLGTSRML
jgi:hypothetical protein